MGLLFDYVGLGATLLVGGGIMATVALRFRLSGVGERSRRAAPHNIAGCQPPATVRSSPARR